MSGFTIRNLSPAAQRALENRALLNRRNLEEEVRAILEEVLCPAHRLHLGSMLAGPSRASGLSNADVKALEEACAADPGLPMWFG